MKSFHVRFVLLLGIALCASPSFAAFTVYNGAHDPNLSGGPVFTNSNAKYSQFLGALSSYGVDGLESYALSSSYTGTLTFSPLSLTATVSTPDTGVVVVSQVSDQPTQSFPSSGNQNLFGHFDFGTNQSKRDLFTFSSPVTAFGLYLNNIGDASNVTQILFTINYANATPQVIGLDMGTFSGGGNYSTGFVGITDTNPISSILITKNTTVGADGVLYDNITAGVAAVPEPTTWAGLISLGLAGGVAWRRRRVKAA